MHGDIQGVGFVFRTWVCDEPWVCACGFLSFALGMLCYVSVFTWSDILRDSTPYHTIPYQTSPIPYQTHSIWSILINHSPLTFSHHISSVAIPIPYHTIPHPPGSPPSAFSFSPPTNHYLTCRDPTPPSTPNSIESTGQVTQNRSYRSAARSTSRSWCGRRVVQMRCLVHA